MEWICRFIEVLIDVAPIAAVVVASMALYHAKKIADRQIALSENEWLPYLSYEKMHVKLMSGIMGAVPSFYMVLKNNGRCIVQYEVKQFKVSLIAHCPEMVQQEDGGFSPTMKNYELEPKSYRTESNIKGVAGINAQLAQDCGDYQFLDEEGLTKNAMFNPIHQYQVSFIVEYGKKGDTKNEYKLKYTIDLLQKDDKFVESIQSADIIGY